MNADERRSKKTYLRLSQFICDLKFYGTFTNLPNHPLSDPATDIASGGFGKNTTARSTESGGNRIAQFALRFKS